MKKKLKKPSIRTVTHRDGGMSFYADGGETETPAQFDFIRNQGQKPVIQEENENMIMNSDYILDPSQVQYTPAAVPPAYVKGYTTKKVQDWTDDDRKQYTWDFYAGNNPYKKDYIGAGKSQFGDLHYMSPYTSYAESNYKDDVYNSPEIRKIQDEVVKKYGYESFDDYANKIDYNNPNKQLEDELNMAAKPFEDKYFPSMDGIPFNQLMLNTEEEDRRYYNLDETRDNRILTNDTKQAYFNYLDSPAYLETAKKMWGDDYQKHIDEQKMRIQNVPVVYGNDWDFEKDLHIMDGSSPFIASYDPIPKKVYVQQKEDRVPEIIQHELSHSSDTGYNQPSDLFTSFYSYYNPPTVNPKYENATKQQLQEWAQMDPAYQKWMDKFPLPAETDTEQHKYFKNATEVRARVNALRNQMAKDNFNWNNASQKDLMDYLNSIQDPNLKFQFEQLMNPEQTGLDEATLLELFQNYAANDTNTGMMYAENGGEVLKKYSQAGQVNFNKPAEPLIRGYNINGSKEEVIKAQQLLKTAGYPLTRSINKQGQFDGVAGPETKKAFLDLATNMNRAQAQIDSKKEIIDRDGDFLMSGRSYKEFKTPENANGFLNTQTIELPSSQQYHKESKNKDGVANCAGGACIATQYVMPGLGEKGLTDIKNKYGITSGSNHPRFKDYGESPDAWDLPGLLREKGAKGLYTAKKYEDITKLSDEEFKTMIKKFPVGTVLNYGLIGSDKNNGKPGYNAKQGMLSGNHTATVVAYNDEGYPITYDYGRYRVLSKNSYGYLVSATVPKEYEKYTYDYLKSTGKLSKSFEYKDAKVNGTAAMTKLQKDGYSVDTKQLGTFISTLKNKKKELIKDLPTINSSEEYDDLIKMASSIAMAETKGGSAMGLGTMADYLNIGKSQGLTQINESTLFSDPILKKKLDKYGITSVKDLKVPEKSAIATMVYLASVKGRAEQSYAKGSAASTRKFRYDGSMAAKVKGSNSVYIEELKQQISIPNSESGAESTNRFLKENKLQNLYTVKKDTKGFYLEKKTKGNAQLTPQQKIAYYWNTPNSLVSGDAQGNNAYVKKVMDFYNYFNAPAPAVVKKKEYGGEYYGEFARGGEVLPRYETKGQVGNPLYPEPSLAFKNAVQDYVKQEDAKRKAAEEAAITKYVTPAVKKYVPYVPPVNKNVMEGDNARIAKRLPNSEYTSEELEFFKKYNTPREFWPSWKKQMALWREGDIQEQNEITQRRRDVAKQAEIDKSKGLFTQAVAEDVSNAYRLFDHDNFVDNWINPFQWVMNPAGNLAGNFAIDAGPVDPYKVAMDAGLLALNATPFKGAGKVLGKAANATLRQGTKLAGNVTRGTLNALPQSVKNKFPVLTSKNFREVVGSYYGIPPEGSLPRLGKADLKAYRQVQELGKMQATKVPTINQYEYALSQNIPEEHLVKVFRKDRKQIQTELEEMKQAIMEASNGVYPLQPIPRVTTGPASNTFRQSVINGTPITPNIPRIQNSAWADLDGIEIGTFVDKGPIINRINPRYQIENLVANLKNKGRDFSSAYPTFRGPVIENVPNLYLDKSKTLKNVANKVNENVTKGVQSGDIFTGSLNTSHNSYLNQLKKTFAYKDGAPQFLGYRSMNTSGFLSGFDYSNPDIARYLNSEIDNLIRTKRIPSDVQRPYFKNGEVYLPQYGAKQYNMGGGIELSNRRFDGGGSFNDPVSTTGQELDLLSGVQKRKQQYEDQLKAEEARVAAARAKVIEVAKEAINNPDYRNEIFKTKLGPYQAYCSTRSCELERAAGYTIPNDMEVFGRKIPAGSKLPVIPGTKYFDAKAPSLGFEKIPFDQAVPGDRVLQFNPFHPDGGHSMVYAGKDGNTFKRTFNPATGEFTTLKVEYPYFYYDNGSGSKFKYNDYPMGSTEEGYRNQAYRYVGNTPAFRNQFYNAQSNLDRLTNKSNFYEEGGEYELTNEEIKKLRKQGYDIELL